MKSLKHSKRWISKNKEWILFEINLEENDLHRVEDMYAYLRTPVIIDNESHLLNSIGVYQDEKTSELFSDCIFTKCVLTARNYEKH